MVNRFLDTIMQEKKNKKTKRKDELRNLRIISHRHRKFLEIRMKMGKVSSIHHKRAQR